jgi:hypothetical protein
MVGGPQGIGELRCTITGVIDNVYDFSDRKSCERASELQISNRYCIFSMCILKYELFWI